MGKRLVFDRKEKDFYVTPIETVVPLISHLPICFAYIDPCCGTDAIPTALLKLIEDSWAVGRYDLYRHVGALNTTADATTYKYDNGLPPWDRSKKNGEILHKIISNLAEQKPTWLLFDADWMHTKPSAPYMAYCVKVVSVGRVKWFHDTKQTGKDNVCWYLFDKNHTGPTEFVGR